jgi:micrococcal nuclease
MELERNSLQRLGIAVILSLIIVIGSIFGLYELDDLSELREVAGTHEENLVETLPISSSNTLEINPSQINDQNLYTVTRIVDGDTIKVIASEAHDNQEITVRLLGIDTPETVAPGRPVECFGEEASRRLENLIQSKEIYLLSDESQADRDRYGRLIRYLVTKNDFRIINHQMILEGFGFEYTYQDPYKYQAEFKQAERYARENQIGLWGEVCNY